MTAWSSIVVGMDFSASAERALETAGRLIDERAGLVLVHVIQPPAPGVPLAVQGFGGEDPGLTYLREGRRELDELVERLQAAGREVEAELRLGRPSSELLRVARERRADLIAIGNSGHSKIERLLLGSTAESLIRRSPVPVLVVGERSLGEVRRVLYPVDFDEGSRLALVRAAGFPRAEIERVALHVVVPPPPVDPLMATAGPVPADAAAELEGLLEAAGADGFRVEVRVGTDPAYEILAFAGEWEPDLVVLSTHGRRGLSRALLGSVSEKLARHANQPVLVLPGPGHGTRPGPGTVNPKEEDR